MPFEIVRNNIADMQVDVIVNTANPKAIVGAGVDHAIHQKAGEELLKARKQIGEIAVGEARITKAFHLDADYVIHTVGPIWKDGKQQEVDQLSMCYQNSLQLALQQHCESIAFPLISTGTYGFPKDLALETAISVISQFLLTHDMMVYLVVFDKKSYALSEKLFSSISAYIDDHYVEITSYDAYTPNRIQESRIMDMADDICASRCYDLREDHENSTEALSKPSRSLKELLSEIDDTFSQALFRWIIKKDLKESDVYKKANMDRKLFSKIRNNIHYQPSKVNAIALAIGLQLNLDETKDLIGRAGYALTHSSKFDIIIEYFISQKNYDVFEINEVLFAFDQPLIGGS